MSTQGLISGRSITIDQLSEIARGGRPVEVIDVRTPAEYHSAHIPIARSEPLGSLDPKRIMAGRSLPGEPLYLICRSGNRSEKAAAVFSAAGFSDVVVNVAGGTLGWEKAGHPLVRRERSVLPLDRKVRIATGILVLLGAVFGYLVNPWF